LDGYMMDKDKKLSRKDGNDDHKQS
jgi:hypothetical protein